MLVDAACEKLRWMAVTTLECNNTKMQIQSMETYIYIYVNIHEYITWLLQETEKQTNAREAMYSDIRNL